ncbi:MAG: DUF1311 domain-containing protein [Blautia sp.]|nr:DUF1311 domain-containing protein [Blautia sp.]
MMKKPIAAGMTLLLLAAFTGAASVQASSAESFTYADLTDVEFAFSSGVGAWGTVLTVDADGSFRGDYHDSNMGETGDGYPNGTIYVSQFSGRFTEPEPVNEYTCRFRIESMELSEEPDTSDIADGVRYVYSEPYGLDNAEDFYLYLPGAPVAALPEDFVRWYGFNGMDMPSEDYLPDYGLYNENAAEGFRGYYTTEESDGTESYIDQLVRNAEEAAFPLEDDLDEGNMSQTELNITAYDVYTIWDDALNAIWKHLQDTLDSETMDALTAEEVQWIKDKEADVAAEASQFEGGSIQPYIESTTAARWTKERVYQLQERYGQF